MTNEIDIKTAKEIALLTVQAFQRSEIYTDAKNVAAVLMLSRNPDVTKEQIMRTAWVAEKILHTDDEQLAEEQDAERYRLKPPEDRLRWNDIHRMQDFFNQRGRSILTMMGYPKNESATDFTITVDGKELRFEVTAPLRDSKLRGGDLFTFCRHHLHTTDNARTGDDGWFRRGDDFAVWLIGGNANFIVDSDAISRHRVEREQSSDRVHRIEKLISGEVRWSV